jgi:hypothetical protein
VGQSLHDHRRRSLAIAIGTIVLLVIDVIYELRAAAAVAER